MGMGFGPGGPRRPRARRGDVRSAVLLLLDEGPRNGYQLIQEIETRSQGAWKPSPGSIYPVLQLLEDEGFVSASGGRGSRTFALTEAGSAYLAEHREEFGTPWKEAAEGVGDDVMDLFGSMWKLGAAAMQVSQVGTPAQVAKAKQLLDDTRSAVYALLASGGEGETPPTASE